MPNRRFSRTAAVRSESFNAEANTVKVVWTTGADVLRIDPFTSETYIERLDLSPGAARLGRLNAGAPFLDSHRSDGLDNIVGSVVPGSVSIEANRQGIATVQLTSAAGHADTVQKIAEGTIRNVSVGYWVHQYDESEEGGQTVRLATDWEPLELSTVPIPADAGAQIRSGFAPRPRSGPARRQAAADILRMAGIAGLSALGREAISAGMTADEFFNIAAARLHGGRTNSAAPAPGNANTWSTSMTATAQRFTADYERGAAAARKLVGTVVGDLKTSDRNNENAAVYDQRARQRGEDRARQLLGRI